MSNKEELLYLISLQSSKIKCAEIHYIDDNSKKHCILLLQQNYTEEDYNNFINNYNFRYYWESVYNDNPYGHHEDDSIIWFEDNSWIKHINGDGQEWIEHFKLPEIPKKLLC